jgi:hypothetical protein
VAAVGAGVITAVDLPALQAVNSILTETVAAILVGAAVWQAYRAAGTASWASAFAAGMLAGLSALVRPVAILLGVALAAAVMLTGARHVRVRAATIMLAASLVIPAAWVARNYSQAGVATFSSIGNINLLLYRAAGTLAIRDTGGIDANLVRRQGELSAAACTVAEARFGRPCASVPIALRATVYDDIALPIILGDPVATAWQGARAFVMIVFGGGASMLARIAGISEPAARLIAFAYTVPLALLACLGAAYWWRIDRVAAALMLAVIAYLLVMSLGVEAYSRFRVPFLPLYAVLAGGGMSALATRSRLLRQQR